MMGKTMGFRTMSQMGALLRSADGLSRISLGLNCFFDSGLFFVDDMVDDDDDDLESEFGKGCFDNSNDGLFSFER